MWTGRYRVSPRDQTIEFDESGEACEFRGIAHYWFEGALLVMHGEWPHCSVTLTWRPVIPPRPSDVASAATIRRRVRSSSDGSNNRNFAPSG